MHAVAAAGIRGLQMAGPAASDHVFAVFVLWKVKGMWNEPYLGIAPTAVGVHFHQH